MEQKIKDYGAEIERMEQMEAMDAQLSKPTSSPLTGKPMNGADKPKTGRASDEYKAAMLNALRTNFRQISNVLSEGIDANGGYINAAVSYAESYQHLEQGYYTDNPMSATTEQAVIMLSSHFYESRDGSTGGFFGDNVQAGKQVWDTVNMLLRLDRRWIV